MYRMSRKIRRRRVRLCFFVCAFLVDFVDGKEHFLLLFLFSFSMASCCLGLNPTYACIQTAVPISD